MAETIITLLRIIMDMLLLIDDVPVWQSQFTDENGESEEKSNGFAYGQAHLISYATTLAVRDNVIDLVLLGEPLKDYLNAPEWPKRHATIIALTEMAENSPKILVQNLGNLALKLLEDPHARVRWATKQYVYLFLH